MQQNEALIFLKEEAKRKARINLRAYSTYMMPDFDWQPYHKAYYEVLNEFAYKRIKKLIITMPPQHGKSQGSTRFLPSFMFGINPNLRLAVTSYNSTIARKFNRDNQRLIDTQEYLDLFPNTTLSSSNVVTVASNYLRNSEEFEIVGHKGMLKAVGRGGALTSITLDCVIMDDLYKDYAEGNSPVVRESAWDWYTTVVKTRLHNDSQQLIVFTRWHEEDIIGRIEANEEVITLESLDQLEDIDPNTWVKINFEAIKDGQPTDIDNRQVGEALWENRHNTAKLLTERKLDPNKFECLYQGNPASADGLLYTEPWKIYNKLPDVITKIGNYTDTADSGKDYLCSVNYVVASSGIYITDILYTQEGMEKTEQTVPEFLNRNNVRVADFESNNGGRYFALNVQKKTKAAIRWFHQGNNKESRINTNSAQVQQNIYLPNGWESRFPIFWKHLTSFKKNFKANAQDGAPDVLTGIIEKNFNRDWTTPQNYENKNTKFVKGDFIGGMSSPWAGGDSSTKGDSIF